MKLSLRFAKNFVKIPLRRETMATRRLRARLAKERQGLDGKWETNKKKMQVRMVKRKCSKLGAAFAAGRRNLLADQIAAMDSAKEVICKLRRVKKVSQLEELMPRLRGMAVTPKLFRQSPALFDALSTAVKVCRKDQDTTAALINSSAKHRNLLVSWRKMYQDSKKRTPLLLQDANSPEAMVPVAAQVASTASSSAAPPRMLTPSRPQKELKSMKLGNMFATMREKTVAEEEAAMKLAKELMVDLASCTSASTLQSLVPRLQGLTATTGVLRQSPCIIEVLTDAAKRLRQSKVKVPTKCREAVTQLLKKWIEMRRQQQQLAVQHPTAKATANAIATQVKTPSPLKRKLNETPTKPTASKVSSASSSSSSSSSSSAEANPPAQPQFDLPKPLPPAPAKQSKLKSFFGGAAAVRIV